MSGTSLDGLDMAVCSFSHGQNGYDYQIHKALTTDYDNEWKKKLKNAPSLSAREYFELHAEYGKFIGTQIRSFCDSMDMQPDAIASHGHTVFHQPAKGFSTQLGCGATIAARSGITTVCDFRSVDVAFGGQGAPLVPVGDELLFSKYQACLNIGGIANISFKDSRGQRVAYDTCIANMLLNYLAERGGKDYDKDGTWASEGKVLRPLLEKLNNLEYFRRSGARSLGREDFENSVLPLFTDLTDNKDALATATEHVAMTIAEELNKNQISDLLVTGGGAHNQHLINRLGNFSKCKVVIPDKETIDFKEALIFAFLGYLRLGDQVNTLSSVTGATIDSIGGAVYSAQK